ncbi:MAG: Flp pilus assembly protein CpaB [Victivallaceae bacterium]|nr:Flp pilus assembly protein CpaB [Victivallaceae bacterium]
MKQKLLLLVAVFFGIVAFVLTYQQLQQEKEKIRGQAVTSKLIRLTVNKNAGEKLTEEDLAPYVETSIKSGAIFSRAIPWKNRAQILGRELDSYLAKDSILQYDDLKAASRRVFGINASIAPGMRAKAIAVDSISSLNYLIRPDDRVDVLGTFRFPEMRGEKDWDTITLTILQNVRIIATGSHWGRNIGDQGPSRRSYSSVTLELSPGDVEIVEFASQKGRLSLSLRNNEDSAIVTDLKSVYFRSLKKYLEEQARRRSSKNY